MAQQQTLQLPRNGSSATTTATRHNHTSATTTPTVVRTWRREQASGAARIQVRDFTPTDVVPAAQLLALRHKNARRTSPELPAAYQSARPWAIKVGRRFSAARGVVATFGGVVVGFMLGSTPKQAGNTEQFEVSVTAEYHAVAQQVNSSRVYDELHAALALRWAREGRSARVLTTNDSAREALARTA